LLGASGAGAGLGTGAAAEGGTQAGLLAAQEAGLGSSSLGWGGAQTGTQGLLNSTLGSSTGSQVGGAMGTAGQYVKPAMQAAQVAKSMAPPPEQQRQAPQLTPPTYSNTLPELVQQNMDFSLQKQQMEAQKRELRRKRIGLIGGY
jgi:hypothetical protein